MGPNGRKRIEGPVPVPLTHKDVDKLIARQRRSRSGERWVITRRLDSGEVLYWGETRYGSSAFTPYRGNAYIYESEDDARYFAYEHKAARYLRFPDDFEVEQLPNPRLKQESPQPGNQALGPYLQGNSRIFR